MIRSISLKSRNDVSKIVKFASLYPYTVHVSGDGAVMVNAASILGLLSIVGINNPRLVFSDHTGGDRFSLIKRCMRRAGIE